MRQWQSEGRGHWASTTTPALLAAAASTPPSPTAGVPVALPGHAAPAGQHRDPAQRQLVWRQVPALHQQHEDCDGRHGLRSAGARLDARTSAAARTSRATAAARPPTAGCTQHRPPLHAAHRAVTRRTMGGARTAPHLLGPSCSQHRPARGCAHRPPAGWPHARLLQLHELQEDPRATARYPGARSSGGSSAGGDSASARSSRRPSSSSSGGGGGDGGARGALAVQPHTIVFDCHKGRVKVR